MARLRYLQNARTGTAGTICKSTYPLQFFDDDSYIYASESGVLHIVAPTSITLTSPTINYTTSTVSAFTYPVTIGFNCTADDVSCLTITSDSESTTGGTNILPLYVNATMSAVGGTGRAIEGKLTVSGKLGAWGNAIKGYLDITRTSAATTGLVSAVCAELKLPNAQLMGGVYAVLELEWVGAANTNTFGVLDGAHTTLIYANVGGTDATDFDARGYILEIEGMSDSDGNAWFDNTLRIAIDDDAWYVPLSTTQGSFTTEHPIVTTFATTAITVGTATTGLLVSGVFTNGISVINTATTTSERHGILVADTFTATGATNHEAIMATTTYTPGSAGAAYPIGIWGCITIDGVVNGGVMNGMQAQLDFTNNANLTGGIFSAIRAVMTDSTSPTFTKGTIAGIYIDNLLVADTSGIDGFSTFLYMANNRSSTCTLTDAIYLYGPAVSNFIMFDDANYRSGCLKVTPIGGDTRYASVKVRVHTTAGGTVEGFMSIYTD